MARPPTSINPFPQSETETASLGVNVSQFSWTTNDLTSVKDIITYVQTALTASQLAQSSAELAVASAERVVDIDAEYNLKLLEIDEKYNDILSLSNNIVITNNTLLEYQSQTKSYLDSTQILHDDMLILRDSVIAYSLQAIYKHYDGLDLASNGSITLKIPDGTVQNFTLTTPVTFFSFETFSDPSDTCRQVTLILKQGTGSNLVTWSNTIKWNNNRSPVLSYIPGKVDFLTFITTDSGSSWYGFYNGGWFND